MCRLAFGEAEALAGDSLNFCVRRFGLLFLVLRWSLFGFVFDISISNHSGEVFLWLGFVFSEIWRRGFPFALGLPT
jgi:hypothetical protein